MKRRLVWGFFIVWEEAGVWVPAPGLSICPHQRREHWAFSSVPSLYLLAVSFPVGWDDHYSLYCVKAKPARSLAVGLSVLCFEER